MWSNTVIVCKGKMAADLDTDVQVTVYFCRISLISFIWCLISFKNGHTLDLFSQRQYLYFQGARMAARTQNIYCNLPAIRCNFLAA